MTGIQHENSNGQPPVATNSPRDEARPPSLIVLLVGIPMGIAGGLLCADLAEVGGPVASIAAGIVGGTLSGIIGSILGGLLASVSSRKG